MERAPGQYIYENLDVTLDNLNIVNVVPAETAPASLSAGTRS